MPRNIEIKARIEDFDAIERRAASIADGPPQTLQQEDVFYNVPRGRLKLRTQGTHSELIYYLRDDATGPKTSNYLVLKVSEPAAARDLLAKIHGQRAIVRKTRVLYLAGQTRIHLDRVEGLGDFVELEVVLAEQQTTGRGEEIANEVMAKLGIERDQLVAGAYVDLLLNL
jgi:predicted adenylyl cyclase CyaB